MGGLLWPDFANRGVSRRHNAGSGCGSPHRVCDPIGQLEGGYTRPGTALISICGICGDKTLLSSGANRHVDETKNHRLTLPLDEGKTIRPFDCYFDREVRLQRPWQLM